MAKTKESEVIVLSGKVLAYTGKRFKWLDRDVAIIRGHAWWETLKDAKREIGEQLLR